jgi:hypothetical protein
MSGLFKLMRNWSLMNVPPGIQSRMNDFEYAIDPEKYDFIMLDY